jgi:hypothetical protein
VPARHGQASYEAHKASRVAARSEAAPAMQSIGKWGR